MYGIIYPYMRASPKVVLVLEDEKPLLEAVRLSLTKNGFKVITARTVEEAKEQLCTTTHVDAIWLDHYLLGRENGLDFVAWCREDGNNKCKLVPIFVVSNTATPEKVASYMSLGAEKYFVKSNHKMGDIIEEIKKSIAA